MTARVYIGRIPYRAHERDIEKFFKGFGKIRDIMLKTGYCFVEFDNYRDADDAVYERNGRVLCGEKVVVEHARGVPHGEDLRRDIERGIEYPQKGRKEFDRPRHRGEYRLIVENLSTRISWQDLKDLMRSAGEVTFADAHRDRRNEGIVEFASRREMEKALAKYDGMDLNGRRIRLFEANKRGRKRSRSRSPHRHSSSRSSSGSGGSSHSEVSPSLNRKRRKGSLSGDEGVNGGEKKIHSRREKLGGNLKNNNVGSGAGGVNDAGDIREGGDNLRNIVSQGNEDGELNETSSGRNGGLKYTNINDGEDDNVNEDGPGDDDHNDDDDDGGSGDDE